MTSKPTKIAVVLLLTSVVGIGGTITAVALLTQYVFKDDAMVRGSIAIVTAAVAALAPLLIVLQLRPYEALRLRNTAVASASAMQVGNFPVD